MTKKYEKVINKKKEKEYWRPKTEYEKLARTLDKTININEINKHILNDIEQLLNNQNIEHKKIGNKISINSQPFEFLKYLPDDIKLVLKETGENFLCNYFSKYLKRDLK